MTQLYYEPLGRLTRQWNGGGTLDWVGDELVAELTGGAITRRYVHGDGADDPMIWYEGTSKRYLHADERGSIIAVSDSAGAPLAINRYDEYGRSQTSVTGSGLLTGRFGYTGQAWLPEIGVYYYKARMYDPAKARFLQSDRLGYVDGLNMFAYVHADPIGWRDPEGASASNNIDDRDNVLPNDPATDGPDIVVTGQRSVLSAIDSASRAITGSINYVGDILGYSRELVEYSAKSLVSAATGVQPPKKPQAPKPVFNRAQRAKAWTLGDHKSAAKWANRVSKGGWTRQGIINTILKGKVYSAVNLVRPDSSATRFVNPSNGLSLVVDDETHQIIQLGRPGHAY